MRQQLRQQSPRSSRYNMETKPIEGLLAENEEAMKPVDKAIEGLVHMDEQQDLLEVTEQAVNDLLSQYEIRRALHKTLEEMGKRDQGSDKGFAGGRLS
jgi:hypothetical protein